MCMCARAHGPDLVGARAGLDRLEEAEGVRLHTGGPQHPPKGEVALAPVPQAGVGL